MADGKITESTVIGAASGLAAGPIGAAVGGAVGYLSAAWSQIFGGGKSSTPAPVKSAPLAGIVAAAENGTTDDTEIEVAIVVLIVVCGIVILHKKMSR